MILSLGPKKLRTKFFQNKRDRSEEKGFWPIFLHIAQYGRGRVFLLGSTRYFGKSAASDKIISRTPRRLWTTKHFEKKSNHPMENIFDFFLLELSVRNLRERFVRVYKVLWNLCCKSCGRYRIISLVPKRLLRTHNFEKKTQPFQWNYNFGLIFSRGIEYDERQVTIYIGPQHVLTTTLLVIGSFL